MAALAQNEMKAKGAVPLRVLLTDGLGGAALDSFGSKVRNVEEDDSGASVEKRDLYGLVDARRKNIAGAREVWLAARNLLGDPQELG
jgi:hypothetical protein